MGGYDSGIDSTWDGATSSNGDIENEESTKADKCEEKANKKGKKRKREEASSNPNLDLDASNIESGNSPTKKGKKRKREEILNLDTSNATNDDSVNSPAKKKKKKKKKDSSD